MITHEEVNTLLPEYVAGGLKEELRLLIESHLETCDECKADLAFWQMVSTETRQAGYSVSAPQGALDNALIQIRNLRAKNRPVAPGLGIVEVSVSSGETRDLAGFSGDHDHRLHCCDPDRERSDHSSVGSTRGSCQYSHGLWPFQ